MNPTARCALLVPVLVCVLLARAGNSVISIPAEIQHFGPLLVVATHDESPDPETLRSDLFSSNKEDRIRLLRAIGVESIPELRELWVEFLHDHTSDEARAITQSISGGLEEVNIGGQGSRQTILDTGFDDTTERPLELRAVFDWDDGRWTHVATLACRCQMTDNEDPFYPHPGRPLLPQEYVVSLHRRFSSGEYHREEIRFRLRGGLLWPLIDFESTFVKCPQGVSYSPACSVVETFLESAKLISNGGKIVPGFVLTLMNGQPPPCDMCGLILRNPKCSAYLWDENAFAYVPSPLKPKTCGPQAPRRKRQTPPSQAHTP
jgi:hypothetical protein